MADIAPMGLLPPYESESIVGRKKARRADIRRNTGDYITLAKHAKHAKVFNF